MSTHFWDEKKYSGNSEWGHFWREKQETIKEKGLVSEDIYWEKIRLLQTEDSGEWGHTFGMKKNP